jgi:hypothetical protein
LLDPVHGEETPALRAKKSGKGKRHIILAVEQVWPDRVETSAGPNEVSHKARSGVPPIRHGDEMIENTVPDFNFFLWDSSRQGNHDEIHLSGIVPEFIQESGARRLHSPGKPFVISGVVRQKGYFRFQVAHSPKSDCLPDTQSQALPLASSVPEANAIEP